MNDLTVPTHTWTTVGDTGLEVYQASGGATMLRYTDSGQLTLALGVVWTVRHVQATPEPSVPERDATYYREGEAAARVLIDTSAHVHDTMLTLLTKAEEAMVHAHYGHNPIRYARAKGIADTIREHLESRT
jgi:hypothetical protein